MKLSTHALAILSTLLSVIVGGTVFFHFIEGWSWIDSYFFTIVTLSTVGYGNLVPATVLGKIATTIIIFGGLGVFASAIQYFAAYTVEKREKKVAEKHHQHDAEDSDDPGPKD